MSKMYKSEASSTKVDHIQPITVEKQIELLESKIRRLAETVANVQSELGLMQRHYRRQKTDISNLNTAVRNR